MAAPSNSKLAPRLVADAGRSAGRGLALPLRMALAVLALATLARVALPIPGTPVPITLQDLGVLLVGLFLGPRRGALAIAAYLGVGALGAPVFSNGNGGLLWLMGPTGGYLLAYPLAAFLVGLGTRRPLSMPIATGAVVAAQLVIFAGGALQLGLLTGRGIGEVLALAVVPFLPGAAIKSGLLIALCAVLATRRAPAC